MGFWNDGYRERSRSRSRSRSPSRKHRSSSAHSSVYSRPPLARSASSFLESVTGYSTGSRAVTPRRAGYASSSARSSRGENSSSRGWFGIGSSHNKYNYGSSSRARPRGGLVAKLRKWLRDLYYYMRRHPMKVFLLVIMPLITGGALTKILSTVGLRLPPQLERMVGSNMNRGYGQNERFYARGGARDFDTGMGLPGMSSGGIGGLGGLAGLSSGAAGIMNMAKHFM